MPDNKTQKQKFEEAARELETDQSEEAFDRTLKRIARAPAPRQREEEELARAKDAVARNGDGRN